MIKDKDRMIALLKAEVMRLYDLLDERASMRDEREGHQHEPEPICKIIDVYLLAHGWTIRSSRDAQEEANYGDSVYVHWNASDGKPRGWLEAIADQADFEAAS